MRTPEEVKRLIRCFISPCNDECEKCEHFVDVDFTPYDVHTEALACIQQLERERDALKADLTAVCESVNTCLACDHYRPDWQKPGCELIGLDCKWAWRGVQE